jgi:hypothetical protein
MPLPATSLRGGLSAGSAMVSKWSRMGEPGPPGWFVITAHQGRRWRKTPATTNAPRRGPWRAGEIHGGGLANADEGAVDGPPVLAADQLAHPVRHVELAVQRPEPRVRDESHPVRAADRQVLDGDILALGGLTPLDPDEPVVSALPDAPRATIVMVRVTGSPAYNRGGLRLSIQEGEQPPAENPGGLVLKIRRCGGRAGREAGSFLPELVAFGFGGQIGALRNTLYTLKAGPAGGRLRRPSSRRQPHDGHRGTGLTLPHPGPASIRSLATSFSPGRAKEDVMPTATDRDFLDMWVRGHSGTSGWAGWCDDPGP